MIWSSLFVVGLLLVSPLPNVRGATLEPTFSMLLNVAVKDIAHGQAAREAFLSTSNGTILRFSFRTMTLTTLVAVGSDAGKMAFDPGSNHLFVLIGGGSAIADVNVSTRAVESTWPLAQAAGGERVIGPSGCLFVSLRDQAGFETVSTTDGTAVAHPLLGYAGTQLAISSDLRFLYTDTAGYDLYKFSTASCNPVQVLRVSSAGASDLAVSVDGRQIYVGLIYAPSWDGVVLSFNTSTLAQTAIFSPRIGASCVYVVGDGSTVIGCGLPSQAYNAAT